MKRYLPQSAIAFGILFCILAVAVSLSLSGVADIDSFGASLALPFQTLAGLNVFLVVTAFGSLTGIITGMFIVMAVYRHRPDIIARLLIALLGVTISGEYLKNFFHRARPPVLSLLQPIESYSFPSGHSSESMVLYGFLAMLLYVHSGSGRWSTVRKAFAIAVPAVVILLIGFSRLVLDYHYLTDVLGGYSLGAFWLVFSFSIPLYYQLYHQNRDRTEPIVRPVL